MMIEQNYNLDLVPSGTPLVVYVSQFDKGGRRLSFTLYKDNVAFTLPTGASATILGTKPDKIAFMYAMQTSGNKLYIDVTEQMTAVAGPVQCEIRVSNTAGEKIGSSNFIIYCEKTPLDSDAVISETDIPVFEELVAQANTAAAEANTASTQAQQYAQQAQESAESIDVSALEAKIDAAKADIEQNTADIATNTANIATKAPLASPALTGTPTAPTAPVGTNTTQIATTAYVQSSLDGWRFYDKDAFSTSTSLATICSSLPNYSIWIKNINSTSDFGGVPSVGLLQIIKFTPSWCILEINYATASANESRKYVASFKSGSSAISKWTRLIQESDLYFSAGDTYASLAGFQTVGMTTNGNKNLYLTVTVPKLLTNINSVTVTRLIGAIRGVNGYIGGSSDGNFDWLTQSYVSRVTAAKAADNLVRIIIATDTAISNSANNTPVVLNGQVTFTFS